MLLVDDCISFNSQPQAYCTVWVRVRLRLTVKRLMTGGFLAAIG